MVLVCADRLGREVVTVTPDWLKSKGFTSKQIMRLQAGKAVHKGTQAGKRCLYWQRQHRVRIR